MLGLSNFLYLHIYLLMRTLVAFISFLLICGQGIAANLKGMVSSTNHPLPYATISIDSLGTGCYSMEDGNYEFQNIPLGTHKITASYLGYKGITTTLEVTEIDATYVLNFELEPLGTELNGIVVTGSRSQQFRSNSAVLVNVLSKSTLSELQTCNLGESLNFQPGLRVETDCQTCNYSQLRINGLTGGYSQILINGRPIFSPLVGLYGLDHIPANMIERIEVIQGGGSSLYGSSAIGGTVNVITRIPRENEFDIDLSTNLINETSTEINLSANASLVSKDKKKGLGIFTNHRNRSMYDHNDDGYSELPKISSSAVGLSFFLLPKSDQKLSLDLSYLHEYRYGGEIIEDKAPHLAQQAEERTHNILMLNVDYQKRFNENRSSLIVYTALQHTKRAHFTGILPNDSTELLNYLASPPYGNSEVSTLNSGILLEHKPKKFPIGTNTFSLGTEFLLDKVLDEIPSYNFKVDQQTEDLGIFIQSRWQIRPMLQLLTGVRYDIHNYLKNNILSPRASLLYKLKPNAQFRLNYSEGFRAPQAFDSDLHIAFAGGGVSRIQLSEGLQPERSRGVHLSFTFDEPKERYIYGFSLSAFYNRLYNAFILENVGMDQFGEVFTKSNGTGAQVAGLSLDLRANFKDQLNFQSSLTVQTSENIDPVEYIEGINARREFMRTPQQYGFAMLSYTFKDQNFINVNYNYTGSMWVPHFAGAPEQETDEIIRSQDFHVLNFKLARSFKLKNHTTDLQCYAGVKNILNSYQSDFDTGKFRDSNYIYGPAAPRILYFGITIGSAMK